MIVDRSTRHHPSTFGAAFLDRLYRMPNPLRRIDDFHRARHDDLAGLTDDALRTELRCVRRRLDYDGEDLAAAWLTARHGAVLAEMADRGRSTRDQPVGTPPAAVPNGHRRAGGKRITSATIVDGRMVAR